ncbi:endonuclease/exonuclease/phosphatase family protein [Brevibacterium oceani]|uniref:endonuclease/exonuclease/phosphatase family protein n=1 Tax=Brevibacterium oceani TaxID=358099 RepID=UPI001B31A3AE|nr:endonuclease/exonuclease/phosphatase family protein [Brevibacterium oceani]
MVTIGTWNLENLFRPGDDSGPKSSQEYESKLDALASTITDLAPDVLAVQEVGDPHALDDLAERLKGTWRTALAEPDARGIRVGFLSKSALTKVEEISDFPDGLSPVQVDDEGGTIEQMGRSALKARIRKGGATIDIVSVHLKSKLLSYPGGRFSPRDEDERARYSVYALHRRAAEASAVRAGAVELLGGDGRANRVIVAGDLNDEPQAATTQILLGPGGSEFGTTGFDRADKGDADRMWNLEQLIPEKERFTRIYRGQRELIDHILVSHALTDSVESVTTGGVDISSVSDSPGRRNAAEASDHRPVVATFNRS